MRKILFDSVCFEDFTEWSQKDNQTFKKICRLIKEIVRDPFSGTGKPEPLKHQLQGYWSRRIDDEHRLVYKVTEDEIIIISCKNHYS
jgi:toxin YoeB